MVLAVAVVLTVFVLVVGVAAVVYLRAVMAEESSRERRLQQPEAHVVTYRVPNGVDYSVFGSALSLAGFDSVIAPDGEHLRVECDLEDRERVRRVIEGVHVSAIDGSDLQLSPVVFVDEQG